MEVISRSPQAGRSLGRRLGFVSRDGCEVATKLATTISQILQLSVAHYGASSEGPVGFSGAGSKTHNAGVAGSSLAPAISIALVGV
jgi:hypothetical protein